MTTAVHAKTCPICGKPTKAKLKPFCSPRCADVDLNRWLAGAYVVPGTESEDADNVRPPERPAH
jgi:endogenous inhibitor of DNA gyrase (YacG/DUF329 family)